MRRLTDLGERDTLSHRPLPVKQRAALHHWPRTGSSPTRAHSRRPRRLTQRRRADVEYLVEIVPQIRHTPACARFQLPIPHHLPERIRVESREEGRCRLEGNGPVWVGCHSLETVQAGQGG